MRSLSHQGPKRDDLEEPNIKARYRLGEHLAMLSAGPRRLALGLEPELEPGLGLGVLPAQVVEPRLIMAPAARVDRYIVVYIDPYLGSQNKRL